MRRVTATSIVLLLIAGVASADPMGRVPVHGLLTDAEDKPIDGDLELTFTLYADAEGAASLWTEVQRVSFRKGAFTAYLGTVEPLDLELFRGAGELHLGIAVGADPEMGLVPISHVPRAGYAEYAAHTDTADTADHALTSDSATNATNALMAADSALLNGQPASVYMQDGDDTNELLSRAELNGTDLEIDEGGMSHVVDLSPLASSFADGDGDPLNEIQTLSRNGNDLTLSGGGGTVSVGDADSDPGNELIESARLSGTVFEIREGGAILNVDMSSLSTDADADPANELQTLSGSGADVTLSGGGGTVSVDVRDADADPANELQTISRAGDTVSLSAGGGSADVRDGDASSSNELITGASLAGSDLRITDPGATWTVDMSPVMPLMRYQRDDQALQNLTRQPGYHMSITAPNYAGRTKQIPQPVIEELCGDADGCRIRIGMTRWSANNVTETASRSYIFYYSIPDGRWRLSSDGAAVDGSGGTNHVINIWDTCYFTDGVYNNWVNQGDSARGMNLLLWNGYGGATRTCELTLLD